LIRLDAATVLLQWATGGLLFLCVTTRRREVGVGYGWLLRGVYGAMALGAAAAGGLVRADAVRDTCAVLTGVAAFSAFGVSVVRRRAGDFPTSLDLVAPTIGVVGLVAAAIAAGGPHALAVARTLAGAAFLGSVSDAMLLGHWYLVQPGLGRAPLNQLVTWVAITWPLEVGLLLWPTGMVQVLDGTVDDKWHGTLGWFWLACAVATIVLAFVTRAALRERAYSAVMAATGLLYLAILTAFGTDLVARAVLAR
jgi:hypothetical protein